LHRRRAGEIYRTSFHAIDLNSLRTSRYPEIRIRLLQVLDQVLCGLVESTRILILGAGLYELASPPEFPAVLANLHTGIWWGAVLLIMGLIYFIRFYPKRK